MTELPEPVAYRYKFRDDLQWQHTNTSFTVHCNAIDEPLFTNAQMLQFRRDAFEEAARVCEEHQTKWLKEADKHRRDRFSDYEQRDLERAKLCEKDARAIRKLKDET